MRHASITIVAAMLFAHVGHAQQIPVTVAAAEAEGAAFPRDPAPTVLPAAYHPGSFGGLNERRCVHPGDSLPDLSVRSGEMILRGAWGRVAGKNDKLLWMPLHDPGRQPTTLSIRGIRLGHSSDTLRQTVAAPRGPAREGARFDSFGFPTLVRFSAPGQWLVVAADDHDWGCFILDIADPATLKERSR